MNICTSYFANVRNLPDDIVPISISAKTPNWWTGTTYSKLAPTYKILSELKNSSIMTYNVQEMYMRQYCRQILDKLNPAEVVDDLVRLASTISSTANGIALICYEAPNKFCHRHLVGKWLELQLGITVKEFERSI